MPRMVIVGVRLPIPLLDELDEMAEVEHISRSDLIRRWLYEKVEIERPKKKKEIRALFGPKKAPHR